MVTVLKKKSNGLQEVEINLSCVSGVLCSVMKILSEKTSLMVFLMLRVVT